MIEPSLGLGPPLLQKDLDETVQFLSGKVLYHNLSASPIFYNIDARAETPP
jgi:hypothetical protein